MALRSVFPSLGEKVAFLSDPAHYGSGLHHVRCVETHMSWVFLAGHEAYKLKKPLAQPYLDFSTLAARLVDCQAEVRLNARLAPGVYLGVTPLIDEAGAMRIAGEGSAVDWLVHMRRLPQDAMLDYALLHHGVHVNELEAIGQRLARFYVEASPSPLPPTRYPDRLRAQITAHLEALGQAHDTVPPSEVKTLRSWLFRFVDQRESEFRQRASSGFVREGHGDLRPEHICLGHPPLVIDCVEFSQDFRLLDTADELAYLALECERLGAPHCGRSIVTAYRRASGDEASEALIMFYKVLRACLRAKLAVWHLSDIHTAHHAKWGTRAREYLALASRIAHEGLPTAPARHHVRH